MIPYCTRPAAAATWAVQKSVASLGPDERHELAARLSPPPGAHIAARDAAAAPRAQMVGFERIFLRQAGRLGRVDKLRRRPMSNVAQHATRGPAPLANTRPASGRSIYLFARNYRRRRLARGSSRLPRRGALARWAQAGASGRRSICLAHDCATTRAPRPLANLFHFPRRPISTQQQQQRGQAFCPPFSV